ncbi:hypothetical protein TCAL_03701 [Tigriopus californicus]|uniref:BPTI/Kunitz inhibitor domain-containing protein n=1 Tax=Tigriopus californicus TaxID=6832 RepID=A0A553N9P8_TIGCA|nr:hypothetical protein TCAL_03701 [Tigriopus californicus]
MIYKKLITDKESEGRDIQSLSAGVKEATSDQIVGQMTQTDSKLVLDPLDPHGTHYIPAAQIVSPRKKTRRMGTGRFALILSILALTVSVALVTVLFLWVYGIPGQINDQSRKIQELTSLLEFQQSEIETMKYEETQSKQGSRDGCSLKVDKGPCMAAIPRWFFNEKSKRCEQFYYGGCQGNGNNFVTQTGCQRQCESKFLEVTRITPDKSAQLVTFPEARSNNDPNEGDACSLTPSAGPCKAQMPRFYFDSADRTCKKFHYGGCAGNANNFVTIDDCQARCRSTGSHVDDSLLTNNPGTVTQKDCQSPPDSGLCRASIERWYYDPVSATCTTFIWGGCDGNENNFSSKDKCQKVCQTAEPVETPEVPTNEVESNEDVCSQPKKVGRCRAAVPRYYFDSESKECKSFYYGGCDANENNFETAEICEARTKEEDKEEGPLHILVMVPPTSLLGVLVTSLHVE